MFAAATTATLDVPGQDFYNPDFMAAAGFLASYSGTTRVGYTHDLKRWFMFCEKHKVIPLEAHRTHIEVYVRTLEEGVIADGEDKGHKPYARSTIGRRLSTVSAFYRWCLQEELILKNPALYVRRPKIDQESTTLGLDRGELGQFLVEAGLSGGRDHALACLLGLNGLRVSEACNANIENIETTRGHRTLAITRKGGKHAVIPLAPRTARTIDLVVGERFEGPILLRNDGQRLDRCAAYRIVQRLAKRAGIEHHVSPHSLRHAFITAALDAGVPLRDVQEAASHADPRTTMRYDRARVSLDRHAAYVVASFIAGATNGR